MRHLRLIFLSLLAASFLVVLTFAEWEAYLEHRTGTSTSTMIMALPIRPVWSPPAEPTYEEFRKIFDDLPPQMPAGFEKRRVLLYGRAILNFMLLAMASAGICGLLYVITRAGNRDVILHYAAYIGIGGVISGAACIILWLAFGGWGPPFPLFFALIGITLGVLLGRNRWRSSPS